jgi:hypothetical protein
MYKKLSSPSIMSNCAKEFDKLRAMVFVCESVCYESYEFFKDRMVLLSLELEGNS